MIPRRHRSAQIVGLVAFFVVPSVSLANRGGPPAARNGSTASSGVSCKTCHFNAAGSGSVQIIGAPTVYTANTIYNLTVRVADPVQAGAGFQISAEGSTGIHRGTFIITDAVNTQKNPSNMNWVNHTGTGVNNAVANWVGSGNQADYNVQWQAPATNVGAVTFWVAGNAINNDLFSTDDIIYLTNVTAGFLGGACCNDGNGVCTEGQTQAACEGGGGRYGGNGSTCATIDPQCVAPPTGACCFEFGACDEGVEQLTCEGGGARYGGDDSTCGTIEPPCLAPPTGACCDEFRGECTDNVTEADCEADGRHYRGGDSTCATIDPPCEVALSISLETVVSGLPSPVDLTHAGDGSGRIFIVDQGGKIHILDAGGNLLPTPFLDVSAKLPVLNAGFDERGLLGLAFHPNYASNGRFFIRHSIPRTGVTGEPCFGTSRGCHTEVLAEYKVSLADPNLADATSEVILFTVDKPQFNHDGGQVAFGPDGYLYFTLGDGGGANDGLADVPPSHGPIGNGQNRFAKLGKIHRIDVDSPPLTSAGWVENPANGHWYRLTSPGLTWQQAEDEAVLLGAHLATINDTEEQTWFNGNPLGEVSGCPLVWIGLYQLPGSPESSDGWVWINGEPVSFTNWRSGEPNDGNICGPSCEQFAEMHYNSEPLGKWNDIPPGGNGCSGGGPGQPGIVERDTAYDVPPDNPFADGVNGLPEIFAYGLRNPWRFSFDDGPGGDEKLWLADVGQGLYEEVNIGALGANYGWVIREGFHCFNPLANTVPPASCATTGGLGEPLVNPVMDYLHRRQCIVDADCAALGVGCDEALGQCENEGGISITGGYVYRGSANPHLIGRYVFGDFSDAFSPAGGRLYYMDTTGPNAFKRRQFFIAPNNPPLGRYVKSFGEDAEGELYVLASTALGPLGTGGVVLRIAPPIPTAAGEGPRYISVEPPPSTEPFALLIAPDCPAATAKYLGPPSGPDTIAHLVDNPVDAAYLTSVQWGRPVHATGADVAPSTNFKVHVDCGTPGSPVLSGGALATTRRWGDVTEPYKPPSDTAQPDFDDISEIVDTFKDAPGSLPPPRVDLVGEGFSPFCIPGGGIDFGDISECVNAFKGFAYPCPSPCP